MKVMLKKLAVILVLLPSFAFADVKSDMANANLSLVQVLQNAQSQGVSLQSAVSQMIKADTAQSSAVIATAIIVAPGSYDAIIKAAIDAGVEPSQVVTAALVASDGKDADKIIAATVSASPASARESIVAASVQALPSTSKGLAAVSASLLRATTARASGGGASVTAADVQGIRSTLNDIEAQLAAAGFTNAELTQAVTGITNALAASQQDVATATASLQSIQTELAESQAASEAVPGLEAELETQLALATAAETAAEANLAAAAAAKAAAAKAARTLAAAEQELADAESANSQIDGDAEELATLADSDPDAAKTSATTKLTTVQSELAALGTEADAQAALDAAEAEADAAALALAVIELDIQKVQQAIAALEAAASAGADERLSGVVTITGKNLTQLQADLAALNSQKQSADEDSTAKTALQIAAAKSVSTIKSLTKVQTFLTEIAGQGTITRTFVESAGVSNKIDDAALRTKVQTALADSDSALSIAEAALSEAVAKLTEVANAAKTSSQTEAELQAALEKANLDIAELEQKLKDAIASVATI